MQGLHRRQKLLFMSGSIVLWTKIKDYMLHMTKSNCATCHHAYTPMSNTASHDNHEKIHSWVSFSFLYGYMVLRLVALRGAESPLENLFVCFSTLPACSEFQQSISYLILSMSILANTLPTMDSRVMPRRFLHSYGLLSLLVWWLTLSSSLLGYSRVPIASSTVDVVYLLKALCLPSIIPLWCNPGTFPFCSCVTASPSLSVGSQVERSAIISFN